MVITGIMQSPLNCPTPIQVVSNTVKYMCKWIFWFWCLKMIDRKMYFKVEFVMIRIG